MGTVPTFESLADEYTELWRRMTIRPQRLPDVGAAAKMVLAGKAQYQEVEAATKVPWYVIGTIHKMECNCSFQKHLHNGDPLTQRTRLVPAGRPRSGNPPFAWDDSAEDALNMKGLGRIESWPVERICYELERYNGWGYRNYHPQTLSPYLWSYTTNYARGKYIADGKWSASAVSAQSGAMAILRALADLDPSVVLFSMKDMPPAEVERPPAGQWEAAVEREFPRAIEMDEGEPVNAPDQVPPRQIEPKPAETADERSWFGTSNFAKLNNLVEQGSTTARSLKQGKELTQGLFHGSWLAAAFSGKSGTLLLIALVLGAIALIAWLVLKRAEKGLVKAAREGRFQTTGAA